MAANPAEIAKRLQDLEALRQPHEAIWRDCFDHSFSVRGSGLGGQELTADDVARKKAAIVDDTATDAGLILASSLMGGMTPANARWFALDVQGADDGAKQWLDEAADTVWSNIHAGGFDAAGLECNLDIVAAGWAVLYIEENTDEGGYRFEQWPLAQCYAAASKRGGVVDTLFRRYSLTASQVLAQYPDTASEETRELAARKPDEKIDITHAIYPRAAWMPEARLARNLPFASCVMETRKRVLLSESGYHEFPCAVPRWRLVPGSVYAVGPMLDALPSARRLNEIGRMELAALDLAISGMWIAENDGVLNPRTVKVGPRKIIVASSVDSMKPLVSGADFNVSFAKAEHLQAQIRKILMADQLQPQDGPAMTATEVHARMALIRQLLGPTYGRLQAEWLKKIVERCFGIAWRAGALTPPPDSLRNADLKVKFSSPLARAARLEDITAMDSYESVLMQQAAADPNAMDGYDWDKARRERAELMGVPLKLLRKADDIATLRDQRQQAMQQQQQQQTAQHAQRSMIDAAGKRMAAA